MADDALRWEAECLKLTRELDQMAVSSATWEEAAKRKSDEVTALTEAMEAMLRAGEHLAAKLAESERLRRVQWEALCRIADNDDDSYDGSAEVLRRIAKGAL